MNIAEITFVYKRIFSIEKTGSESTVLIIGILNIVSMNILKMKSQYG